MGGKERTSCSTKLCFSNQSQSSNMTEPGGRNIRQRNGGFDFERSGGNRRREDEENDRDYDRRRTPGSMDNSHSRGDGERDSDRRNDATPEELETRKRLSRLMNILGRNNGSPSPGNRSQSSKGSPEEFIELQLEADEELPFELPKTNGPVRSFARAVAQQSMVARLPDAHMVQSEQGLVALFCEWKGVDCWLTKEGKEVFNKDESPMPKPTQLARASWDKWVRGVFVAAWSEARSDFHKEFKKVFPQVFKLPDVSKAHWEKVLKAASPKAQTPIMQEWEDAKKRRETSLKLMREGKRRLAGSNYL